MKAFIALVCLVAVVVSQEDAEPTPLIDTSSPEPPTTAIAADTSSNDPTSPKPPTSPTADSSSDAPSSPQPPTTTPVDSSETDPIDPVDCDSENEDGTRNLRLLPDPKSCENFYACNDGLPILMVCPAGLHFNPKVSLCDWPQYADCTVTEKPTTKPKPNPTAIFNF